MVARTLPYLAGHGVAARDLAVVAYGGAGAIHVPLLAEEIGVNTVLVPRLPSVFCAFGGLVSSLVYDSVRVLRGSEVDGPLLREAFEVLADESMQWLHRQAPREWLSRHTLQYFAEMRYQGQSFEIPVLLDEDTVQSGDLARFAAYFHQEHLRLYSHSDEAAEVEYVRSEEHTSELQSLMRISYAVFCLETKNTQTN